MNILITGVTGLVGCYLAKYLTEEGYTVIGIARSFPYNDWQREALRNVKFISCNILDSEKLRNVIVTHDIKEIFHLSAETYIPYSFKDFPGFLRTNLLGTATLLEACKDLDVNVRVASTDKVIGECEFAQPYTKLEPLEPYGYTKKWVEELCQVYTKCLGFKNIGIFRACNIVGYDLKPRLIPKLIRQALKKQPLIVYNDYDPVRQFIDARDLVEALVLWMKRGLGLIHIATNEIYSVNDIVRRIAKKFGVEVIGQERKNLGYFIEPERQSLSGIALELLGWKQKYRLDDMIEHVTEMIKRYG